MRAAINSTFQFFFFFFFFADRVGILNNGTVFSLDIN